jgi:hypothetical protein
MRKASRRCSAVTFFEDGSNGLDHIRLVRADFDNIFADGFG